MERTNYVAKAKALSPCLRVLATWALAIATLSSAQATTTYASYTSGTVVTSGGYFIEQTITTSAGSAFDDVVFNFYANSPATTPTATGTIYLLSEDYTGSPDALTSSTPGYIASATASGGYYTFNTSVTLQPETTYYLAMNGSADLSGDFSLSTSYSGPDYLYVDSSGSTSDYSANTTDSMNYQLTGQSTAPEPGSASTSLLGALVFAAWATWRRGQSRARTSRSVLQVR